MGTRPLGLLSSSWGPFVSPQPVEGRSHSPESTRVSSWSIIAHTPFFSGYRVGSPCSEQVLHVCVCMSEHVHRCAYLSEAEEALWAGGRVILGPI